MSNTLNVNQARVDSINGATGNISISGRNLLQGSKDYPDPSQWVYLNRWEDDGIFNGCSVKKKETIQYGFGRSIALNPGTYTFSAWAKTDGINMLRFCVDNSNPSVNVSVPIESGEWKRVSITFTITESGEQYCPRLQTDLEGTLWICGHKLEEGNVATSWSPAPEDLAYVNNIVNSVNGVSGDVILGTRNYIALSKCHDGYVAGTGAVSANSSSQMTDYIPLHGVKYLTVSQSGTANSLIDNYGLWIAVSFYNSSHEFISPRHDTFSIKTGEYETVQSVQSVPENAEYAICSFHYSNISNMKASLTFGNTPTDWCPAPEDKNDVIKKVQITLTATGWNSGSQTATVSGILEDDSKQVIIPIPISADTDKYYRAGVVATSSGLNKLNFWTRNIPDGNLTVNVIIIPVE